MNKPDKNIPLSVKGSYINLGNNMSLNWQKYAEDLEKYISFLEKKLSERKKIFIMDMGKLKDSYPKISAVEIIKAIASEKISGMWLTERENKKAKEVCNNITDKEATKLLYKFDKSR